MMRTLPTLLALFGLPIVAAGVPVTSNSTITVSSTVEVPGPSPALFANPFYTCVQNYYVSPTGNDANRGTQSAPWATLQHADAAAGGRVAGDCVNVAPGTYAAGVMLRHGGNLASATGYVAYRCQRLDRCKITSTGGNGAPTFTINTAGGPNYIVIDGFEMAASSPVVYGNGVFINNNGTGEPTGTLSVHHIWIINNVIHGYGESGIGTNEADWIFALHNLVYNNAMVTCDAQGSGIGLVVAKVVANYLPTTQDQRWAPFHQVVAWNVARDNIITRCGSASSAYDTDGNGIIVDTFNGNGVDNVSYPDQTLVANNVVYSNGGKGIQIYRSSHVTVANNTAYNNNLDPWNRGYPRGEINLAGGTNNQFLSNIAYAIPAASIADPRCQGATYNPSPAPCPLMANVALMGADGAGVTDIGNLWSNNITFGGNPPWGWGPRGNVLLGNDAAAFSCTSNKCNANPLLTNAEAGNFSLQSNSPAIAYGLSERYLSPQSVDAGVCYHTLTQCP